MSKKKVTAGRYKLLLPYVATRGPKVDLVELPEDRKSLTEPEEKPQVDVSVPSGSRLVLQPITNKTVSHEIDIVKQYLEESGVTLSMYNSTRSLLQNNILPYNPYPGYIKRFRKLAERFHLQKQSLQSLRQSIDCPSFTSSENEILSSIKGSDFSIWGLDHIVAHVSPKTLEKYSDIVQSSTISNEQVSQETEQQISLLVSMSGPCVFNGSIYQDWLEIEVKCTVLITAQDYAVAAKYFALAIVADLGYVTKSKHLLIDLSVPIEEEDIWTSRVFTNADIQTSLSGTTQEIDDLKRQLIHAVMSKKRIQLNLLLCQSSKASASKNYLPANKTYNMMFLQTAANQQGSFKASPPRLVISTLPFQALHEGIYFSRSAAEQYLSTYQKYYTLGGAPQPAAGRKIKSKIEPMHPDMLNPILQAWQMKIASLKLEHSSFLTLHYMILLTLAQTRNKSFAKHTEDDLIIQICRFLLGTAARLKSVLFLHSAIVRLLPTTDETAGLVADRMIAKYKDSLLQIVDPELSARSSETQCLKHMVAHAVRLSGAAGAYHSSVRRKDLQELADAVSCAMLGLVQDALELSPAITTFKAKQDGLFPQMVPRLSSQGGASVYPHGMKNPAWLQTDKMKLNRQVNTMTSQAPKAVASHLAMMQYSADVRIDQVWRELYENLLLSIDHLPPNPYPLVVSLLRKANASVQSFFETDASAAKRMIQRKIVALDGAKGLLTVTSSSAFAQRPPLTLLNPLGHRQVLDVAAKVLMSPPGESLSGQPIQAPPFQLASCGGLVPPTIHYGAVSPYLRSLDLDEHCFLRGPSDKSHQAPSIMAKIVLSHLRGLRTRGVITKQVSLGGVVLKLSNLTASAAARFESELIAAVNGGEIITFQLFYPLEWRYLLVRKRILLYFVNENNDQIKPLFRNPEGLDHRSFTVFLHPNDAKYCVKQIPIAALPPDGALAHAWQSRDWLTLVTQLACRGQMTLAEGLTVKKNGTAIGPNSVQSEAFALLAFCWRYSSGIPGQIDYLRSLNYALESVMGFAVEALDDGQPLASVIDQALVERMILQYRAKLKEVTSQSCALSPSSLPVLLQTMADRVAVRDLNSSQVFIQYDKEALRSLREINGHVIALRNAAAQDLLHASSIVYRFVKEREKRDVL